MNSYIETWKKSLQLSGRSRRKEYWMFVLVNTIISIVFTILIAITANIPAMITAAQNGEEPVISSFAMLVYGIYMLFALISVFPGFTVSVRRMHDINKSGFALLFGLIPFVGGIIILVFTLTAGTTGNNEYGKDPKAV